MSESREPLWRRMGRWWSGRVTETESRMAPPDWQARPVIRQLDAAVLEDRILMSASPMTVDPLAAAEGAKVDPAGQPDSEAIASILQSLVATLAPPPKTPDHDPMVDPALAGVLAPYEDSLDSAHALAVAPPTMPESPPAPSEPAGAAANMAVETLAPPDRQELVFIDGSLSDYQHLVDDLAAHGNGVVEVIVLDSQQNGFAQIHDALEGRHDLDAIHFVTHGADGAIKLGDSWLHAGNVNDHASDLMSWRDALADGGDLLFHGCDVAQTTDGQALLHTISQLTDADVAASTNDTGHANRGGDWVLEFHAGQIESSLPWSQAALQSWDHTLAAFQVTNTNDSGAGSLRQAILDANALPGLDTITFDITGTGPHAIHVTTALDAITDAIHIDGTSEPNYTDTPVIELHGDLAGFGAHGLTLAVGSAGSTIEGLSIVDFSGHGILIQSDNNLVQANYIGVTNDGTVVGNGGHGIAIVAASGNMIGSVTVGAGNVIAGNGGHGVDTQTGGGTAQGNSIVGNLIHDNAGLGINLDTSSVALNDVPGGGTQPDLDGGANDLQNYPVLSAVTSSGGNTAVSGTLDSTPNTTYRLEFFSNTTADGSGHGEGAVFLGAVTVTTNAAGHAQFVALVATGAAAGSHVTATATAQSALGVLGGTSEFAANAAAVAGPVNILPNAQTVHEDTALTIGGLSVMDANLDHVQIAVAHGTVSVTLQGSASFSAGANNSDTITISGSLADVNATLATLAYRGGQDYSGPELLTITTTSVGGATDADILTITVAAVNDAPVVNNPGGQNGTEDTDVEFNFYNGNEVSVDDHEAGNVAGVSLVPSYVGTVAVASTVTLDLWANYNTLGVRMMYTEDAALANTTVSGTLQILVNNQWFDAHDFVHDVDQQMLVSKIFGLAEGQTYSVRASFIRHDASNAIIEQRIVYGSATMDITPDGGTGGQVWIAPNGNDANPGTYAAPKRTIAAAAAALPVGGFLMLKDGDYFFDSYAQEGVIRSISGTAAQPYTIMAEHPGMARLYGYEEVNSTWTSYGNGIYYTDVSSLMHDLSSGEYGPNRLVDAATGKVLYTYRSLATDSISDNVFGMEIHSEPGWYLDFATNRLYVKLASGVAPTVGQVRAGAETSAITFANSNHWIVDGIHFEQFGQTYLGDGSTTYHGTLGYAVFVAYSDNVTIRNSTFWHCSIGTSENLHPVDNLLIEDNAFYTNGIWDVFYHEPFSSDYWQRMKATPLEITAVAGNGTGRGMVVRDNTFEGFGTAVTTNSDHASLANDIDIYRNVTRMMFDDVYELDTTPNSATTTTDGGNINTAIFHNVSYDGLSFVSMSALHRGPVWIVGNYAEQSVFNSIKAGQQSPSDPYTNSTGWKLIYSNTFLTDAPHATIYGSPTWSSSGFGNLVAKNNIFVGRSYFVFNDSSGPGAHRAPSIFESNVFYTSYPGPYHWHWEGVIYTSEDALDAAATMLEMTNNIYGVNPYPAGFNGPLNAALLGQGVAVKGITNIAAHGGAPIGPAEIGYFTGFAYSTSGGGTPLVNPVQVTLVAAHGDLTLASLAGLTFTVGDGAHDATLTFTGLIADINAALDGLRFTPTANYHGAAQVQITINDLGYSGSGGPRITTDTIALQFAAVNDAPVASADSYTTSHETPLLVALAGVLGNDLDIDGDFLTVALLAAPAQGALVFNADGSFTYTPPAGFVGTTTFTYRVSDGTTTSQPTTVTVVVRPPGGSTSNDNGNSPGVASREPAPAPRQFPSGSQNTPFGRSNQGGAEDELQAGDAVTNLLGEDPLALTDWQSTDNTDVPADEVAEQASPPPTPTPTVVPPPEPGAIQPAEPAVPVTEPVQPADEPVSTADPLADFELIGELYPPDEFESLVHSDQPQTAVLVHPTSNGANGAPVTSGVTLAAQSAGGQEQLESAHGAVAFDATPLLAQLAQTPSEVARQELLRQFVAGAATVLATTVSAGYTLWLLRGTKLIAVLFQHLPSWLTPANPVALPASFDSPHVGSHTLTS